MKNVFWLSACLIISAIFSSCSNDDEKDTILPEGEKTSVNVTLNIAPVNAMGTNVNDQRTSIENFWLLQFDQQGKNVAVVKELRFNINSPESVEVTAGANMKLVVLANVDKSIVFQLGRQTYDELKNAIYTIPISSSNSIPLVGEQTVSITKENQTLDAITLERIGAELKFAVSNVSPDFKLKSLSVKNIYKMYYLSKGENTQGNVGDYVEIPCTIGEESYTFYLGENLMGTDSSIASEKDKVTDKLATYIEIVGERMSEGNKEIATFKLFLGENAKDFNVKRNHSYSYDIELNLADAHDKRITTEKLPLEGIASESNCYMISPDAPHDLLIPVKRVNAFWGTSEGGLNVDYMLSDGNNQGKVVKWKARVIKADSKQELITFTIDEGTSANDYIGLKAMGKEGNVLIGIYDATSGEPTADAKPLWSWHIWITKYNPGGDINGIIPAIAENPGKAEVEGGYIYRFGGIDNNVTKDGSTQAMMDRNLGAIGSTPEAGAKANGAYYQFGRKDPFIVNWDEIEKIGVSPSKEDIYSIHTKTQDGGIPLTESVRNPDVYYLRKDLQSKNWLDSNRPELWYQKTDEKTKTLYDPCPPGWRVPRQSKTFTDADGEDVDGKGIYLYPSSIRMYFTFSGYINPINGTYPGGNLFEYQHAQMNWIGSCPDNPYNAYRCRIFPAANVDYDYIFYPIAVTVEGRDCGYTVRCVKE